MPTVNYFLRTGKTDLASIYVRFKSGRSVDQTAKAKLYIHPQNWSEIKQEVKQRASISNKDQLNQDLKLLRSHIEDDYNSVRDKDNPGKGWLKTSIDKYWNPEKYEGKTLTLFAYIEDFISKSKTRLNPKSGKPVCYKMRREYERTFHYLKEFAKRQGREYDFKDIDLDFYHDFTEYLQELNLATNTIGKKIQTLKIFLNTAKDEGKNPYEKYRSKRFAAVSEEADTIYLTEDELLKIGSYDFSKRPALERVRDLFLVGCWTGVRFSDITQIHPDNILDGMIHLRQTKTGGKIVIPVLPVVQNIIDKYDGMLPEPISNQKFNDAVKKVAKIAKVNNRVHKTITKGGVTTTKTHEKWELVTTHTARRSFATNLYNMDFPAISIMQITGHKTESAFLRYIRVTPEDHARKLRDFVIERSKNLRKVS